MRFENFPKIYYELQKKKIRMVDITRRVALRKNIVDVASLFYEYRIQDRDRPEDIANRIYGDPRYNWVIFLVNDIIDPYTDWPVPETVLLENLTDQFGTLEDALSESNIHHWETENPDELDYVIPTDPALREQDSGNDNVGVGAKSVSWYTFASEINEQKRVIKILRPEYLRTVVKEIDTLLSDPNLLRND